MAEGRLNQTPPPEPEEELDDEPEQLYDQLEEDESDFDPQETLEEIREPQNISPRDLDNRIPSSAPGTAKNIPPIPGRSGGFATPVTWRAPKGRQDTDQQEGVEPAEESGPIENELRDRAVQAAKQEAKEAAKVAARAAKEAVKDGAKAAAQAIKKFLVQLLTKNPIFWLVIGIILLIIIIVAVIFSFSLVSRGSGKGPAQYPSNASQREQATLLAALSGDKIANDKTVDEVIKDEKDRYQRIRANAQKYSPDKVAAIDAKIAEFTPVLDSLLETSNKAERTKIRDDLEKRMLEFEGTLPFGKWIAANANAYVGKETGEFCTITGASARLACASFTSTTLAESGVPNAIVGNTTALWHNKALRLVIDRAPEASNSRINESIMQPGDIVWFGNGSRAKNRYAGALFDHVGIYIGDGMIVDTSSSKGMVMKRPLTTHQFNGAKRYGANL